MQFRFFLTNALQFPFRAKLTAFIIVICLLTVVPTQASDNVEPTDNPKQLIKQAKKLARRGEFSEAEKVLRRAVRASPLESKAKLNLAAVLLKQRQLLEAYELSFEVAKAEPKNSFAFAILGTIFLGAGNFRDAETFLLNSLRLNRDEASGWAGLGMLNFYENRIPAALEQLKTAVALEPSDPDYMFSLAQIAARAEDYLLAAQAYEKFLQISPLTDAERRARIKGLIGFLTYLGNRQSLYASAGASEAVVPIRLVNDRPIIELKINGEDEPLKFVLDTGSGISVLSDETARRLKIKSVARGGLARGVGGDGKFEIVYGFLRSIDIGAVKIRNVPVYIRRFHSNNEKIDGYIGLSLISKFLTTIDYGNSSLALKKKTDDDTERAQGEAASIPLRLTSSGFLSGEVELEGVKTPLNFIVDTGASISVISNEIADLKEISPFIRVEKMRVIGAAGITGEMPTFLLPKISFGAHSRESIKTVALDLGIINETSGFDQSGILGGNFLKNYRLTFDFANSKVIFVPVK
ncbi:MAG TPA: aspartyl protease family protein [Pyrinomonadaceae bacterium]|nr:aspartyl protease family protein [Pyrinomonadaceae bacterium]